MNARTKLFGTVALGAALFVPVAQAERPDDAAGPRGPGAIAIQQMDENSMRPDDRAVHGPGALALQTASVAVRPDDRAGVRGPGSFTTTAPTHALSPDNSAEPRGPGAIEAAVVERAPSSGFDFGDALIGLAGGMGLALLITGSVILLASQRRNKTRLA